MYMYVVYVGIWLVGKFAPVERRQKDNRSQQKQLTLYSEQELADKKHSQAYVVLNRYTKHQIQIMIAITETMLLHTCTLTEEEVFWLPLSLQRKVITRHHSRKREPLRSYIDANMNHQHIQFYHIQFWRGSNTSMFICLGVHIYVFDSRWTFMLCAEDNGLLCFHVTTGWHKHKILGHWSRETGFQLNSLSSVKWMSQRVSKCDGEREREREREREGEREREIYNVDIHVTVYVCYVSQGALQKLIITIHWPSHRHTKTNRQSPTQLNQINITSHDCDHHTQTATYTYIQCHIHIQMYMH